MAYRLPGAGRPVRPGAKKMETEKLVLTPQKASFLAAVLAVLAVLAGGRVAVLAGGRWPVAVLAGPPGAEHCAMQHEVSCTNLCSAAWGGRALARPCRSG